MKKYLSKADKFRGIISPEYAAHLQNKYKKKKWKKKEKDKVIKTLPYRLATKYNTFDFSKFPKKEIQSLFIFGETGTGKTILSAHYYVEFVKQLYMKQSLFNKSYNFVVFSRMIEDLQRDFATSTDIMKEYMECDLLVMDEFGVKKLTEYVYDRIYLIINERYLNMLPTIINSNNSLDEIRDKYGDDRIVRRIIEDYELIEKIPYK